MVKSSSKRPSLLVTRVSVCGSHRSLQSTSTTVNNQNSDPFFFVFIIGDLYGGRHFAYFFVLAHQLWARQTPQKETLVKPAYGLRWVLLFAPLYFFSCTSIDQMKKTFYFCLLPFPCSHFLPSPCVPISPFFCLYWCNTDIELWRGMALPRH